MGVVIVRLSNPDITQRSYLGLDLKLHSSSTIILVTTQQLSASLTSEIHQEPAWIKLLVNSSRGDKTE